MDYNVKPDTTPFSIFAGDTWDVTESVALNGAAFDMTGMQLDGQVCDDIGNVVRSVSSAGTSPAITISTSSFNITDDPFTVPNTYIFSLVLTNGSTIETIKKCLFYVNPRNT